MRARWMAILAHMRAYVATEGVSRRRGAHGMSPRWFGHGAVRTASVYLRESQNTQGHMGAAYGAARGDVMGSGWRMRSGRVLLSAGKSGAVMVIYGYWIILNAYASHPYISNVIDIARTASQFTWTLPPGDTATTVHSHVLYNRDTRGAASRLLRPYLCVCVGTL